MMVKDHVTISIHCAIGGNIIVEERTFLGLNATARNNVRIAKSIIVAAGSNLVHNRIFNCVYMRNPAKEIGKKAKIMNI